MMAFSRALKRLIRALESLRARANSLSKGIEGLPRLAGSPLTSLQRFLTGTCLQDPLALERPSTSLEGPYKLLTGSFYKLLTALHRSLTSPCRRLTSLCVLQAPDTPSKDLNKPLTGFIWAPYRLLTDHQDPCSFLKALYRPLTGLKGYRGALSPPLPPDLSSRGDGYRPQE